MDEKGFRHYLKQAGKKEHVVDGLIRQVWAFEKFLMENTGRGVNEANEQDIHNYTKSLEKKKVKTQIRGLLLYYKFIDNTSLAIVAHKVREEQTAKTRQIFKLRKFRGVDLGDVEKLEAIGIVNIEQMLDAGKTPEDRQKLARQTGIPSARILELVKLSDLSRIGAIKSVRARLYYDAGLDTPDKFTHWDADELRQMLIEFVKQTGFNGIAPLPKELRNAIEKAKKLRKVVQY